MSWLVGFLRGLVTKHVGTKVLSLLLAIVVFVFVQQTLIGNYMIPGIVLRFELADELQSRYVLLTPSVEVTDVTIEGLHSEVNSEKTRLEGNNVVGPLRIDEAFLRRQADPRNIELNQSFLNREPILREGVSVVRPVALPRTLRLDNVATPNLTPTLAADADRTIQPDNPRQPASGDKLAEVRFEPAGIRLKGPASAFPDTARVDLIVVLPDLDAALRAWEGGDTVRLPAAGFDVPGSGMDANLLDHVEVVAPEKMTWAEFVDRFRIVIAVKERPEKKKVPLAVVATRSPTIDLGQYDAFGAEGLPVTKQDYENGECKDVELEMPATLVGDEEFLSQLRLVVDVAAAKERDNRLVAPIYLDVKVRSAALLASLERVRLVKTDPQAKPAMIFQKK